MSTKDTVCAHIQKIMRGYREQMEERGYIDTPGGLEHMGDVWSLLSRWDEDLNKDVKGYDVTKAARSAEIRERMKRLDEPAGEDYLVLLDTVLHQDLPYLLNLAEETDRLLGRES